MLRVTCTHCKHEFNSSIVNPGKVSYKGCNNVFQLEFNVKIPCPSCKNILGLLPLSPEHAKGVPTKEFSSSSLEKTQSIETTSVKPALPKTVVKQTKASSHDATIVKPFRVLASDSKKVEPLRLQINKQRVSSQALPKRAQASTIRPIKFLMYAVSALIVSSITAFTMFTFKNAIMSNNAEVAMESLVEDELGQEGPMSEIALGGPTEDLVIDKAEDDSDLIIPEKYKKNILYLPELAKMSSGFGIRLDPFTRKMALHGGVDFKGKIGDNVDSAMDGLVVHAGPRGRYGKIVIINHGKGLETRYAHLSRVMVKKGQKVKRGQLVGKIGNSGRSTGPHLHLEVIKNGQKVNPLTTKLK